MRRACSLSQSITSSKSYAEVVSFVRICWKKSIPNLKRSEKVLACRKKSPIWTSSSSAQALLQNKICPHNLHALGMDTTMHLSSDDDSMTGTKQLNNQKEEAKSINPKYQVAHLSKRSFKQTMDYLFSAPHSDLEADRSPGRIGVPLLQNAPGQTRSCSQKSIPSAVRCDSTLCTILQLSWR